MCKCFTAGNAVIRRRRAIRAACGLIDFVVICRLDPVSDLFIPICKSRHQQASGLDPFEFILNKDKLCDLAVKRIQKIIRPLICRISPSLSTAAIYSKSLHVFFHAACGLIDFFEVQGSHACPVFLAACFIGIAC